VLSVLSVLFVLSVSVNWQNNWQCDHDLDIFGPDIPEDGRKRILSVLATK
jgi:hypothetical protein